MDIDQIIQIGSILASGLYVGWQIRSAKKHEIEFRVYQQRKEEYDKLLKLLRKIFVASKSPGDQKKGFNLKKDLDFGQDEWLDAQFGMSTFASEEVLNAYLDVVKTSKENPMLAIRKLGDMLLTIRKEVGIDDKNLSNRAVLSTFINDIYLPKYDELFNE